MSTTKNTKDKAGKNTPKKFCSLLSYIEHTNRELYDAIHDLCGAGGAFSTRKRKDEPPVYLTLLMPERKSDMCKKILSLTYSDDPEKAISLIKSCVLTEKLYTSAEDFKEGETVKTKNGDEVGIAKVNGGKITLENGYVFEEEKNFGSLYTPQRISVFKMAGSSTGGSVHGGAPAGYQVKDKMDYDKSYIAVLCNQACGIQKSRMLAKCESGGKLTFGDADPFVQLACSFWAWCGDGERKERYAKYWRPNPMSIIPMLGLYVDDKDFCAWMCHKDEEVKTSYDDYKRLEKKMVRASDGCGRVLKQVEALSKDSDFLCDRIRDIYADLHSDSGGDSPSKLALCYDECCFVLYDMCMAIKNSNIDKYNKFKGVLNNYMKHRGPILCDPAVLNKGASAGVKCKVYEFTISDTFAFPCQWGVPGAPDVKFTTGSGEIQMPDPREKSAVSYQRVLDMTFT